MYVPSGGYAPPALYQDRILVGSSIVTPTHLR